MKQRQKNCNFHLTILSLKFPDNKKENMGIDSTLILLFALSQLPKGFKINNIDLTIIFDKVKLSQYRNIMIKNLIDLTKCKDINVKFTRFEDNSEMIGCSCIVSILKTDNHYK